MIGLLVNIASIVLGIYLSIIGKNRNLQIVVWLFVLLISVGNIYVYFEEQKKQPYLDLVTPNISSMEALEVIKNTYKEQLDDYDLIDVIGSYYICLKKPDTIFHRFPEWVFVFRNKTNNQLIEYKVSANNIPNTPMIDDTQDLIRDYLKNNRNTLIGLENESVDRGFISYYIASKKGVFSGGDYSISYKNFIIIFDKNGRSLISISGRGPTDNIDETVDGATSQVLARVQIADRPTSHIGEWIDILGLEKKGSLRIKRARFSAGDFYQSIPPINNWKIDIDEAISIAVNKGGKGFPLGKERIGGPGVVRLFNGRRYNIEGAYWKIPYRLKTSPILISAVDGTAFVMNEKAEYVTDTSSAVSFDVSYKTRKHFDEQAIKYEQDKAGHQKIAGSIENDLARWEDQGIDYYRSEQYRKAISQFTKLIEIDPDYSEGYNNRGLSYAGLGQHSKAVEDFTKSIAINPSTTNYLNRSISYRHLEKYDLAIADANMAIKLNPKNEEAYLSRGNAYLREDEEESAIADYTAAIEINPEYSDAYYNRGTLYGKEKEMHKEAISDFSTAIRLNSKRIEYYLNRANSYLSLSEIDLACSDLNAACNLGQCQYLSNVRRSGLCQGY